MSVEAIQAVLTESKATHAARLLAIALANHARPDGTRAHPGLKVLREETRLSRASLYGAAAELKELGEIEETGKAGKATCYRLTLPSLVQNLDTPRSGGVQNLDQEPSTTCVGPDGDKAGRGTEQECLEGVGAPGKNATGKAPAADIELVFEKWKELYGGPRVKLIESRKRRIRARLKDGRTPDELIEALEGAQHDDWLMGRKEGSPGYTGIDTLLRDDEQVRRLIALKQNPPTRPRAFKAERDASETGHKGW